jgi:hypothetical protein
MGYQNATGQVVVGTTDVNMGDIVVNEMAFPPSHVVATEATDGTNVTITWNIPTPGENISEGFEGTLFPPENWSQIITDNGPPVGAGILPTWCQAGTIALTPAVPPHSGSYQAAMWWDYNHQDEWLITPQFICPADADLTFWSYVYLGSTNGDHYYIKVSTDNGNTWTVLWDASTLTGGWNYYATPIVVPLSNYAGQQIKLAWHADDPPSADGMWYVWFVDDVSVGNAKEILRFPTSSLTRVSASDSQSSTPLLAIPDRPASRALANSPILRESNDVVYNVTRDNRVLTGYKVYRLLSADQSNENLWTPLTPTTITNTSYVDNSWAPLPSGVYRFAVKAVYTNNVLSPAAFSNEIHKGMMGTLTGTVTEFGTNVPIEGATITAGEYSGTSNAQGVYSFSVYQGTYTVTCSKPGYQTATQTGVNIVGLQTTTVNFVLTEITLPPAAVQATEVSQDLVNLTWMAPGTGTNITEGFEGTTFPPTDWSQIITDNGPPVGAGILPTWCQAGTIALTPAVPPHGGSYQAAMWWDYNHQDEWLITPQFICPGGTLTFWSYVYLGSTNGDHYYIKVSTDNGNTWTVLWDASDLTGGWNYYATPIVIDLDSYAGQEIKLAWHADDPPSNDGMWYVWFVDDVTVGNTKETIHFPINTLTRISAKDETHPALRMVTPQLPTSRALASTSIIKSTRQIAQEPIMRNDRVLNGYKVWRLLQGQETNESAWTLLTTDIITATAYQDTGWGSVPDGIYKWAVKAVYTSGALSNPAFSNALPKWTQIGTIAGTVKNQQNAPIAGAAVTCENVTATTNASGAYSMQVPAGTRSVTASAPGYDSVTQNNVIVVTGQTTTVNFILPPSIIVELLNDSFETYENFALTFAPWTCVDVDQSTTYGIEATFPNCYSPMAYIIFVPSATTPPLTATGVTHTGNKIAASFAAATTFPNNDWLITPSLLNPTQIKFWARSYTAQYGLERFKVGVSTTGTNPSDFTIISGPNFVEAPVDWTEYTYPITGYTGNVYIGIQCVSNDAFIFLVDDVLVMGTQGPNQNIPLSSGWNLISLNVSPADHSLNVLLAPIINQVIQVKGLDGVYIPNNPFSTLTTLTDGRAYNILMSSPATWTVSGAPIPVSTPILLSDGWNLAAYFPTIALSVTEAMSSISEWLLQVKGTDGVYIPGNPYSTLTTMYPGKGYWIKINGAHNLIYPEPARTRDSSLSPVTQNKDKDEEQVQILSNSLTLLARCNAAEEGDYLLARVEGELRGKEKFISPEGFLAVLLQVYTETASEEISFSLLKPDGREIVLATTIISEPGAILGDYPEFLELEATSMDDQVMMTTQLKGCYPNPFNPSTTISFSLGEETQVNIDIYNLKGQKVRHLTSDNFSRGEHKLLWDGKDDQGRKVASGIYFAEMRTPTYKKHIKMLLTK